MSYAPIRSRVSTMYISWPPVSTGTVKTTCISGHMPTTFDPQSLKRYQPPRGAYCWSDLFQRQRFLRGGRFCLATKCRSRSLKSVMNQQND